MFWVIDNNRILIIKHNFRIFKANAMLFLINGCFISIPFKGNVLHKIHYNYIVIFFKCILKVDLLLMLECASKYLTLNYIPEANLYETTRNNQKQYCLCYTLPLV